MTTITITVIQRKPERFMMKHTNPPQMTLSEFFFSSFFYGLSSLTENLVCFRAVLCVGEERCVPTQRTAVKQITENLVYMKTTMIQIARRF